jgi:hypothetical protein
MIPHKKICMLLFAMQTTEVLMYVLVLYSSPLPSPPPLAACSFSGYFPLFGDVLGALLLFFGGGGRQEPI